MEYERIKARRKELGLTQTELAKKTGYKEKSAIAKIEHGAIEPPLSKIIEIANALCVSPHWLMGDSDAGKYNSLGMEVLYNSLDSETAALVDRIFSLEPDQKKMVIAYIDGLLARS